MDDLARRRRQLIVRGAGLVAVLCAYMMFMLRRAREQTPRITIGRRVDSDIAMGSNEALGKPIDVEGQGTSGEEFVDSAARFEFGVHGLSASTPSPSSSTRKRKRPSILSAEDTIQCNNMSDAVREIASAINNTCHAETHLDLYKAVMDLVEFSVEERLAVLDYLTEHKGKGLNFVKMEDDVRRASFKRIIQKNPDLI